MTRFQMPPPQTTWREIRRCTTAAEAESVTALLAAAGIRAVTPSPHAMRIQPTCRPAAGHVGVLVPADLFLAAQAHLAAEASSHSPGDTGASPRGSTGTLSSARSSSSTDT